MSFPFSPNINIAITNPFNSYATLKPTILHMDPKLITIKTSVSNLSSNSELTRLAALRYLRLLSNQDPTARPLISDAGAVPLLSDALFSTSHPVQDNAAATILNLSISDRRTLVSTRRLLDALAHLISHHNSSSSLSAVQSAAATLHSLLAVVPEFRPVVGARPDIIHALIDVISSPDSPTRSVKDVLKASFGVALHPPNRTIMIRLGAVTALFTIMANENRRKCGIMEDTTAVIAQIAGCEESEEVFRAVSGIPVLSSLLGSDHAASCSLRTKENAVSGLLNLVRYCGEEAVREVKERAIVEALDGIVYVQEHGSPKGKSKAVALLKVMFDDCGGSYKNFGDLYPVEPDL